MARKKIVVGVVCLMGLALVLMAIPQHASSRMAQQSSGEAEAIPHFIRRFRRGRCRRR